MPALCTATKLSAGEEEDEDTSMFTLPVATVAPALDFTATANLVVLAVAARALLWEGIQSVLRVWKEIQTCPIQTWLIRRKENRGRGGQLLLHLL